MARAPRKTPAVVPEAAREGTPGTASTPSVPTQTTEQSSGMVIVTY